MDKLTTYIVDILRRKKEAEALARGGQTAGGPTAPPSPEVLGSGGAQRAAVELLRRKSAPMDYVDSVQ